MLATGLLSIRGGQLIVYHANQVRVGRLRTAFENYVVKSENIANTCRLLHEVFLSRIRNRNGNYVENDLVMEMSEVQEKLNPLNYDIQASVLPMGLNGILLSYKLLIY